MGRLIGLDSEDLGEFEFLAGQYNLLPPELEKIENLKKALSVRPELTIELSGVFDPAIDVPALKFNQLRARIYSRLDVVVSNDGADEPLDKNLSDDSMMIDVKVQKILENMLVERFPETSIKLLKEQNTKPPAGNPEAKPLFDAVAYSATLRDQLLASEQVTDQDLHNLAMARSRAIQDAFLKNGEFDGDGVKLTEAKAVESDNGEWVKLELSVSSD